MQSLLQDLRYSLRVLVKNPGFTGAVVLILAFGIGATSSIFSLVHALLLRPLPYAQPERLCAVSKELAGAPGKCGIGPDERAAWAKESRIIAGVAGYHHNPFPASLQTGEEATPVYRVWVTKEIFQVLGVHPFLGRLDSPADAGSSVVLSHDLWQRQFGGDPNIIGRSVSMEGNWTVMGVLPPGFRLLRTDAAEWFEPRSDFTQMAVPNVVVRLQPGVTLAQARTVLATISRTLDEARPASERGTVIRVQSLHDYNFGSRKPMLLLLLGAAGFVLVIACANVASLLLARGARREREIGIRTALGASRVRIVRQTLTESLLLAAMAGMLGLLLAEWGVALIRSWWYSADLVFGRAAVGLPVVGFTVALSVLTVLVFGLVPAIRSSRVNFNESLKEGTRSASGTWSQGRLSRIVVVCEVALALTLVTGAVLLARSFERLNQVDLGFHPENVLVIWLNGSWSQELQPLAERVQSLPGVQSAAITTSYPMDDRSGGDSQMAGKDTPQSRSAFLSGRTQAVNPGYFHAMGIPFVKGRDLAVQDMNRTWDRAKQDWNLPPAAIVSEGYAREKWPDQDPIGREIHLDGGGTCRVVGVVGDVRHYGALLPPSHDIYTAIIGLAEAMPKQMVVRTKVDPYSLVASIRKEIRAAAPQIRIARVQTMEQIVARTMIRERVAMLLVSGFGAVAALLAALGIYGLVSYVVSQRTREIGIRMAMGADKADVLELVLKQGMGLVAVGILLGVGTSLGLTRFLTHLLFGISPFDGGSFTAAAGLLFLTGLAACWLPARRAASVDPMVALRYE